MSAADGTSGSSSRAVFHENIFSEQVLKSAKDKFDTAEPFHWVRLDNVLSEDVLEPLEENLMGSSFVEQDNDLFRFYQSSDLSGSKSELVKEVVSHLYSDKFRQLVTGITGVELNNNTDVTCSVYQPSNMLLCHDDKLMGRRIAFIFYLVPKTWNAAENGGTLDLFGVDQDGKPNVIAKRLTPVRNSLLMFKVCDESFHQVAEVIGSEYRLSMGGWFHGPPDSSESTKPVVLSSSKFEAEPITCIPDALDFSESLCEIPSNNNKLDDKWEALRGWVNPMYLDPATMAAVAKQFEEESFISLQKFIIPARYTALCESLATKGDWKFVGPYNRRQFGLLDVTSVEGEASNEFSKLTTSTVMKRYLEAITGLDLSAKHSLRVRRFSSGCYELAHDGDPERQEVGLDTILCCVSTSNEEQWSTEDAGGAVVFADEGDEEPLAFEQPQPNTLTLAYRAEPGTYRFVRYVSQKDPEPRHDFAMTWRTVPDQQVPAEKKVKEG